MNEELEKCEECGRPMEENHVCWGQSNDFAVVKNISEDEEEKPAPPKKRAPPRKPQPPAKKELSPEAVEAQKQGIKLNKDGSIPKKRGRPRIMDGKTAQQRWRDKNRNRVRAYQRQWMKKKRNKQLEREGK